MRLLDQQNTKLNIFKSEISKFTPQIFVGKKSGIYTKPNPEATSVLLELNGHYFVVTAGHVLAHELSIGFALGRKFYPLHQDLFFYYYDSDEQTINNKWDIGVVKIESDTVDALKQFGYQFINYNHLWLSTDHSPDNWYLLLGFPAGQIKHNKARRLFKCKPFSLITKEIDDMYPKLGIGQDYKLVVKYDRKRIERSDNGETIIGPELKGVSGSGLWWLADGVPKLAAIFTDWDRKLNLLTATRTNVIVEILRQRFQIDLPKIKNQDLENLISESFVD